MAAAGATSPRSSAPGRPSTTASISGAAPACGTRSCADSKPARWAVTRSTGNCSASTAPSSGRTSRPPGGEKKNPPPGEPEDHALGRSQGGFGTKLHLICDGEGTPIAVAVGPGQEHETPKEQVFPGSETLCSFVRKHSATGCNPPLPARA